MKTCRDCGNKDGATSYCRPCMRKRGASYRRQDAEARGLTIRVPVPVGEAQAHCPNCRTVKSLQEFGRRTGSRTGRTSYCRACHNAKSKESRLRLHGGSRNYHLQQRYGITAEDYDRMLADQGGRCALCQERPAEHVDHDHLTGRVRGLLCFCCNQGLGSFRDRADVLRLAIGYVHATTWRRERLEPGVYRLHPPRVS